jgi:hypothetical protein
MLTAICKSPWCKASFPFSEEDRVEVDGILTDPKECPKCKSFNTEMSGGVTWTDKEYEGSRFDGMPHQIRYKVTNYR